MKEFGSRDRHSTFPLTHPQVPEALLLPEYYSPATSLAGLEVCRLTQRLCTEFHASHQQESVTCWKITGKHWKGDCFLQNRKEDLEELAQRAKMWREKKIIAKSNLCRTAIKKGWEKEWYRVWVGIAVNSFQVMFYRKLLFFSSALVLCCLCGFLLVIWKNNHKLKLRKHYQPKLLVSLSNN